MTCLSCLENDSIRFMSNTLILTFEVRINYRKKKENKKRQTHDHNSFDSKFDTINGSFFFLVEVYITISYINDSP